MQRLASQDALLADIPTLLLEIIERKNEMGPNDNLSLELACLLKKALFQAAVIKFGVLADGRLHRRR